MLESFREQIPSLQTEIKLNLDLASQTGKTTEEIGTLTFLFFTITVLLQDPSEMIGEAVEDLGSVAKLLNEQHIEQLSCNALREKIEKLIIENTSDIVLWLQEAKRQKFKCIAETVNSQLPECTLYSIQTKQLILRVMNAVIKGDYDKLESADLKTVKDIDADINNNERLDDLSCFLGDLQEMIELLPELEEIEKKSAKAETTNEMPMTANELNNNNNFTRRCSL